MNLSLFVVVLSLTCILSFLLVDSVRRWALTKCLDIPNARSSHRIPTPRGGGLGIFVVVVAVFLVASAFFSDVPLLTIAIYCLSASMIALTGWLDDRHTLSSSSRLAAYSGATLIFILGTGVINAVHLPSIVFPLLLGLVPAVIFTFVWLVGFVNAFNFMDGIDGIAGSQALIAALIWCVIFMSENQWTLALLAGLVAAASLGFLFLNAPPAKIFMGDVGSTFLGFTLAALPVLAFQQLHNPRLITAGIFMLAPFLFDTSLTLIRRAVNHENILQAHCCHLYQRLVKAGFSHAKVTTLYIWLALVSALGGLVYYFGPETQGTVVALLLLFLHVSLLFGVRSVENKLQSRIASTPMIQNI